MKSTLVLLILLITYLCSCKLIQPPPVTYVDAYYNLKDTTNKQAPRFYVVVGSYEKIEEANQVVDKLIKEGFPAVIVETEDRFRVSLSEFSFRKNAEKAKKAYVEQNPEEKPWIYSK